MGKSIFYLFLTNILVVITISFVLSVLGVGSYLTASGIDYSSLMVFCLVWGMGGAFISLRLSKFMAIKMMGVKVVNHSSGYRELIQSVHRFARSAGLEKMPEVGIYQSKEVNAFATGPSRSNSLVAVSTGLLERMNKDEIEGVLAHEVAHIANGDMVTMTLIQGVINAFVMALARIASLALQNAMSDEDEQRPSLMGHWIFTMIFEAIFGFLGLFVVAYFSRQREFRADAGGAKYAGKYSMISALKKLQSTFDQVQDNQEAIKCMKISSRKGLLNFLSTHPSLEERIKRLELSPGRP